MPSANPGHSPSVPGIISVVNDSVFFSTTHQEKRSDGKEENQVMFLLFPHPLEECVVTALTLDAAADDKGAVALG